jgi:hypothetical protein
MLDVLAQVEFESKIGSKIESDVPYFTFKRSVQGALSVGLIGSTCTALP